MGAIPGHSHSSDLWRTPVGQGDPMGSSAEWELPTPVSPGLQKKKLLLCLIIVHQNSRH